MADDKTDIQVSMKKTIGEITSLIQDETIAKEVRNRQIETIVTPLFDFGLMARLSLGKTQWKKITPEERKTFTTLFEERVKQSYMSKLDLYTDEVVIIDDAVQVKSRIHLSTHLIRKNERRDILYKFYKSKKRGWLIYDVDILGVSIIQTYRTQFAGILKEDSFAKLIEKLKISES
jgi:phospholipid transport system substrate-binding protein